jgi:hypothetical protein
MDSDDLAGLLPAARVVQASVTADGQRLARAVLADRLRRQGVTVSNARLSALRRALDNPPFLYGVDKQSVLR